MINLNCFRDPENSQDTLHSWELKRENEQDLIDSRTYEEEGIYYNVDISFRVLISPLKIFNFIVFL